jgi:hypothetical protein
MPVELDPGEGLDVGETVLALALTSEVVASGEPDVEDTVETLGLIDVPCKIEGERSIYEIERGREGVNALFCA